MDRHQRSLKARQAIRNRIARQRRRLDRKLDPVTNGLMFAGSLRSSFQQRPAESLLGVTGIVVWLAYSLAKHENFSILATKLSEWFKADSLTQLWRDFLAMFRTDAEPARKSATEEQDG